MKAKRITRPTMAAAALAALLFGALLGFQTLAAPNVAGANANADHAANPSHEARTETSHEAADARTARRFAPRRLRHTLRMPFFSFQPLG